MTAALNILQNKFGGSKKPSTFVMPNTVNERVSQLTYLSANKAEFLRQFYVSSFAVFGDIQGSSVSFVTYIPQIFGLKMPNTDKNLNIQTAQGASGSTASTRKNASRAKSRTLFQIRMKLSEYVELTTSFHRIVAVDHTAIYEATSEHEAVYRALVTMRLRYKNAKIDLNSILVEQIFTVE